jgi:hypothetical protein
MRGIHAGRPRQRTPADRPPKRSSVRRGRGGGGGGGPPGNLAEGVQASCCRGWRTLARAQRSWRQRCGDQWRGHRLTNAISVGGGGAGPAKPISGQVIRDGVVRARAPLTDGYPPPPKPGITESDPRFGVASDWMVAPAVADVTGYRSVVRSAPGTGIKGPRAPPQPERGPAEGIVRGRSPWYVRRPALNAVAVMQVLGLWLVPASSRTWCATVATSPQPGCTLLVQRRWVC